MNRLVTAIVASLICVSPALANPYNHGRHDNYRTENRPQRQSCGALCGAIIGGLVVGIISSESRRKQEHEERYYDRRYTPPVRQICQTEYARDARGNYMFDYYGRPLIVEKCWYQ